MASDDVLNRAGKFLIDRTDDMDAWYMVGDLAAALRESRRDSERLDWCLENLIIGHCTGYESPDGGTAVDWIVDDRAEIDAAMGESEND